MTWQTELQSWMFPTDQNAGGPPAVGQRAPQSASLEFPQANGKATILSFLRHCGCPFAEKTFRSMRSAASDHPDIRFIAISHSDQEATDHWLEAIGGPGHVEIIVNTQRKIYAAWGLGVSSFWHVLSPWSLFSVYDLGKQEGIWNRPTESGTRWQPAGSFAVDGTATIRWARPSQSADDVPDMIEAVEALKACDRPVPNADS